MDKHQPSSAPLFFVAIALAIVPIYVGSYLANVQPEFDRIFIPYRFGNEWAQKLYWPLEQIDRKVRSDRWGLIPPSDEEGFRGPHAQ